MPQPQTKLMPSRKNRGFTLVELLITVAVVGVLTSIALPSFNTFIAGQRIKTASFDVMSTLILTRSEAIKRNANVTASPTGGNWKNGWTITAADGTVISRQSALKGLEIKCAGSTACSAVTFGNNGRSVNSETIQLESDPAIAGSERCISLDLSGRPNTKKGAC